MGRILLTFARAMAIVLPMWVVAYELGYPQSAFNQWRRRRREHSTKLRPD